jgi:O-antigen biosynthesis protein
MQDTILSTKYGDDSMEKKRSDQFTGEYFIPGQTGMDLYIEHMQRYLTFRIAAWDKTVLDAGCGEGYGSDILAAYAKAVTGIDISGNNISRARKKYARGNLVFKQASLDSIPLADRSVDLIFCFEVIEHMEEPMQQRFLRESARILRDQGMLIISTPNKKLYTDKRVIINEFHKHEFSYDEFKAVLSETFEHVLFLRQNYDVFSILIPENEKQPQVSNIPLVEHDPEPYYMLAVCSAAMIDEAALPGSIICFPGEYERMNQRIVQLQQEVEERSRWGLALDEEIARLRNIVEERNGKIEQLEAKMKKTIDNDAPGQAGKPPEGS